MDEGLRTDLKREGFLTRDARIKERKKAGLKGARKRPAVLEALGRPCARRRGGCSARTASAGSPTAS